jgi:hypothetical protein
MKPRITRVLPKMKTITEVAYSVTAADYYLVVNASANAVTITLHDATVFEGGDFVVKAVDITNEVKVISASGTIDGILAGTGITYIAQYDCYTYTSDGTRWLLS